LKLRLSLAQNSDDVTACKPDRYEKKSFVRNILTISLSASVSPTRLILEDVLDDEATGFFEMYSIALNPMP